MVSTFSFLCRRQVPAFFNKQKDLMIKGMPALRKHFPRFRVKYTGNAEHTSDNPEGDGTSRKNNLTQLHAWCNLRPYLPNRDSLRVYCFYGDDAIILVSLSLHYSGRQFGLTLGAEHLELSRGDVFRGLLFSCQ
jgi:hypothetical protein